MGVGQRIVTQKVVRFGTFGFGDRLTVVRFQPGLPTKLVFGLRVSTPRHTDSWLRPRRGTRSRNRVHVFPVEPAEARSHSGLAGRVPCAPCERGIRFPVARPLDRLNAPFGHDRGLLAESTTSPCPFPCGPQISYGAICLCSAALPALRLARCAS